MAKNKALKNRFLELRGSGTPYEVISSELGLDKETLLQWSHDLKSEIQNYRAMRLEAIHERNYITSERRAELIGSRIAAIKAELETRDLKGLSTKELEELLIKYSSLIEKDRKETVSFMLTKDEGMFGEREEWQG